MGSEQSAGDDLDRILRLADGCDPTALPLSAAEGYLLSRIDGHTPWRVLREMGGIDADEADMVMEGWLASGTVVLAGHAAKPKQDRLASRAREVVCEPRLPDDLNEAVRNDLDLEPDVQRRILEFEARLGEPDHALLGVEPDADAKEVKKAYFRLSKEFHPDRFFRRDIGPFKERLDRIFKRVADAYENLINADAATESGSSGASSATAAADGATDSAECDAEESPENARLRLLKQRMPFKMDGSVPEERREQAEEIFKAVISAERMGRITEALSQVRLALTFDPKNRDYSEKLRELKGRYGEERCAELLGDMTGLGRMSEGELDELTDLLAELVQAKSADPTVHWKAAEVAIARERNDDATKLIGVALELAPDVAAYHVTRGMVHKQLGEIGHAKKEFARALELDPNDDRARQVMASIRPGRPSAKGGNR